jgi:hypothetical protein
MRNARLQIGSDGERGTGSPARPCLELQHVLVGAVDRIGLRLKHPQRSQVGKT